MKNTANPPIYSTAQAAEYLGISTDTLKHYMYKVQPPAIKPDAQLGNELVFFKPTLDAFHQWHRPAGYTIDQAAAYLGVNRTWVNYHLYVSKKLKPDGRRGKAHIFSQKTLDAAKDLIKPE